MDATCKVCGNPAGIAAAGGAETTCNACWKRLQRRRLIFDVTERSVPAQRGSTPLESALAGLSSPAEETRMLDILALVRRTQESLTPAQPAGEVDAPISVREAILLADSMAPAAFAAQRADAGAPPATPSVNPPARKPTRAVYSGAALVLVMAAMVALKAQMSREEASAASLEPSPITPVAAAPAAGEAPPALIATVTPAPPPVAPAPPAPTATPRKAPPRPPSPRPAPTAVVDTGVAGAGADPASASHSDLLEAMHAAVAAHAAPPSAPKGGCPPTTLPSEPGAPPAPCARGESRTSSPRP